MSEISDMHYDDICAEYGIYFFKNKKSKEELQSLFESEPKF